MPVSTGSFGEPRAKRCKLCDESSHRSESGSGYWQLQLDPDLVDTISAIYPEWFKNNMAEGGSPSTPRESPPKAVIDTSPILMDQNKESLKVKLLLRRPFDQLVAQGIMPPHKTPAAYHGQRRQLERAKTGDMLKAKIQQRPPRQELERRHILEADPGHVDPSLAERQRKLKKARLADQLNDQLSHRPGPLELIQKNILHTEEPIEEAVKTGRIPYKATSEGQLNRPQHPQIYVNPEDDSQSSEGDNIVSPSPSDVLETAAKSAGIVTVSLIQPTEGTVVVTTTATPVLKDPSEIVFANLCNSMLSQASSPASFSTPTLSPLSVASVASPVPSQPPTPIPPPPPPISLAARAVASPKSDAPGKDKNRKKSKSKSAPKTRTIKFHEYKGPPSAQKTNNPTANAGESSYDLLLKQQTLLLQFQLQLQHKYPQIILPASQKAATSETSTITNGSGVNLNNQLPSPAPSTSSESSTPARINCRLEDMKVSDLKAELKRRSLPVSGSKPQLIERLKSYSGTSEVSSVETSLEQSHNSPQYQDIGSPIGSIKEEPTDRMEICEPLSPTPSQNEQFQDKTNEDIVREQQRQIEMLQRKLTLSQLQLQAATRAEPKAQLLALQKHLQAKQQQQQLQQHAAQQQQQQNLALQVRQLQALQARQAQVNEEQQRIQQQQHVAFQNQKNLAGGLVLNGPNAALVFNQILQGKAKMINGHNRTSSLPNFVVSAPLIEVKTEEDKAGVVLYDEGTTKKKNYVKSQIVDDVLEILIKNGELPPSAANDPTTPGSAGTKNNEPVYPSVVSDASPELDLDPNELLDSLDSLDNMDINQLVMELQQPENNNLPNDSGDVMVPMDTDEWLESLLPSDNLYSNSVGGNNGNAAPLATEPDLSDYDPLLGITQDPFDPFNLEEFRSPDLGTALSWDKVDYAA